jgi:hypothetical protein
MSRCRPPWSVVAVVVALACGPQQGPTTAPSDAASPASTLPPSRHDTGALLEGNVPLAQGGVLPLVELRGKLVVVEVVDAAHRDDAVESDYAALQRELGERLVVVLVSLDHDGWQDQSPPFVLGWDPQGAFAARLQAASLPTVLLLDAQGRIVQQYAGARTPGHRELVAAVHAYAAG